LSNSLEDKGFNIFKSTDGKEGLEVVLKEHSDLRLLDIIMPEVDGLTMLEKLREDEWGKTVEVILLTNLFDVDQGKEVREKGPAEFLVKSNWAIDDIIKKLEEKLDRKE